MSIYIDQANAVLDEYKTRQIDYKAARNSLGEIFLNSFDQPNIEVFKMLVKLGLPLTYNNGEPLIKAIEAFKPVSVFDLLIRDPYSRAEQKEIPKDQRIINDERLICFMNDEERERRVLKTVLRVGKWRQMKSFIDRDRKLRKKLGEHLPYQELLNAPQVYIDELLEVKYPTDVLMNFVKDALKLKKGDRLYGAYNDIINRLWNTRTAKELSEYFESETTPPPGAKYVIELADYFINAGEYKKMVPVILNFMWGHSSTEYYPIYANYINELDIGTLRNILTKGPKLYENWHKAIVKRLLEEDRDFIIGMIDEEFNKGSYKMHRLIRDLEEWKEIALFERYLNIMTKYEDFNDVIFDDVLRLNTRMFYGNRKLDEQLILDVVSSANTNDNDELVQKIIQRFASDANMTQRIRETFEEGG